MFCNSIFLLILFYFGYYYDDVGLNVWIALKLVEGGFARLITTGNAEWFRVLPLYGWLGLMFRTCYLRCL